MESTKSDKICILCHEDCSNRPRTRDSHGRYYCQSCYNEEKQRRASGDLMDTAVDMDISHMADHSAAGATASMTATAFESPVGEENFDIATSAHAAHRCGFCKGIIAADAAFCPGCGKRIAGIVELRAKSTPVKYSRESFFTSTKKSWPEVVGLTGVCCGRLELLVVTIWMVMQTIAIVTSENIVNQLRFWELATWKITAGLIAAVILFTMSWWLIRAGNGLRMKSKEAVESIRLWALSKIGLSLFAFILTFALAPDGLADSTVMLFAVTLVWLFLWPAFILYWTGQMVVRQQVHEWGKNPRS